MLRVVWVSTASPGTPRRRGSLSDPRVRVDRNTGSTIARVTLDNPARLNAYDKAMREALLGELEELAYDDAVKVVLLRGEGGVFSTGADMNNAYAWYGEGHAKRPTQRRRLLVDR